MIQITVSDEQARALAEASPPFLVVDRQGKTLGQITPVDPAVLTEAQVPATVWAEIQRRMREPGEYVTFEQLKERLGW
jgi:hypothetical protein